MHNIENVTQSFLDFVSKLDDTDKVGIITFADDTNVLFSLSPMTPSNKTMVKQTMATIQCNGHTNISAALERSKSELIEMDNAAIILLTDGRANRGVTTPTLVRTFVTKLRVDKELCIHTIGYGDGYDETYLHAITARGTSDSFTHVNNTETLTACFANILSGIRHELVRGCKLNLSVPKCTEGRITGYHRIEDVAPLVYGPCGDWNNNPIKTENDIIVPFGSVQDGETKTFIFCLKLPEKIIDFPVVQFHGITTLPGVLFIDSTREVQTNPYVFEAVEPIRNLEVLKTYTYLRVTEFLFNCAHNISSAMVEDFLSAAKAFLRQMHLTIKDTAFFEKMQKHIQRVSDSTYTEPKKHSSSTTIGLYITPSKRSYDGSFEDSPNREPNGPKRKRV